MSPAHEAGKRRDNLNCPPFHLPLLFALHSGCRQEQASFAWHNVMVISQASREHSVCFMHSHFILFTPSLPLFLSPSPPGPLPPPHSLPYSTGMAGVPGTASQIFSAVRSVGANVMVISQASSEHSVCFIHSHLILSTLSIPLSLSLSLSLSISRSIPLSLSLLSLSLSPSLSPSLSLPLSLSPSLPLSLYPSSLPIPFHTARAWLVFPVPPARSSLLSGVWVLT